MPVTLHCKYFPLSADQVSRVWQEAIRLRQHNDDAVAVGCVSPRESAALNKTYRGRSGATNVLTFSYGAEAGRTPEHDVALCLSVVKTEARQRLVAVEDYAALVLAHAFLHASGLDHATQDEARAYARAERTVLARCGFRLLEW